MELLQRKVFPKRKSDPGRPPLKKSVLSSISPVAGNLPKNARKGFFVNFQTKIGGKTPNYTQPQAALDIPTSIASTLSSTAVSGAGKNLERSALGRERSWSLREGTAHILPDSRVAGCGRRVVPGRNPTVIQSDDGRATFGNIQKCGSVWLCAVCQYKISIQRAAEVARAVRSAHARGLAVVFLTLTAAHSRGDKLGDLAAAQAKARRSLWSGRAAVARRERFGIVGSIANLEVTWGEGTGWHPHSHVLVFCEPDRLDEFADVFWAAWEHAATGAGLTVARSGFDCRLVDVGDDDSVTRAAHYLTKPGAARWGIGAEIAAGNKQAAGERLAPLELVDRWIESVATDHQAAALFREYAAVFSGRRQLWWSRGLRDLLGLNDEETDDDLANQNGAGTVVGVLTHDEWGFLIGSGLATEFLRWVEQHGFDYALEKLQSLHRRAVYRA